MKKEPEKPVGKNGVEQKRPFETAVIPSTPHPTPSLASRHLITAFRNRMISFFNHLHLH